MNFPTIQLPDLNGFGEQLIDSTISTPMEAGYEQTRPRYTYDREIYTCPWEACPLSDADYIVLKAFLGTVRIGSTIFSWTHPVRKTVHDVRIKEVSEFRPVSVGGALCWRGRIVLKGV